MNQVKINWAFVKPITPSQKRDYWLSVEAEIFAWFDPFIMSQTEIVLQWCTVPYCLWTKTHCHSMWQSNDFTFQIEHCSVNYLKCEKILKYCIPLHTWHTFLPFLTWRRKLFGISAIRMSKFYQFVSRDVSFFLICNFQSPQNVT